MRERLHVRFCDVCVLTKDCNSVYTTVKLLSAPSKSLLISEFFEFPTDVSQTTKVLCCSTNAPNGFPSDKKKERSLTTSQRCRNPSSSHVLSAFLLEHEMSAAYQDGRFKFSMRARQGLSSTLLYTQAADRTVRTNKIWTSIAFDAHAQKTGIQYDLNVTNTYDQGNSQCPFEDPQ